MLLDYIGFYSIQFTFYFCSEKLNNTKKLPEIHKSIKHGKMFLKKKKERKRKANNKEKNVKSETV